MQPTYTTSFPVPTCVIADIFHACGPKVKNLTGQARINFHTSDSGVVAAEIIPERGPKVTWVLDRLTGAGHFPGKSTCLSLSSDIDQLLVEVL